MELKYVPMGLNREAMAAISRRRQPADLMVLVLLSREAAVVMLRDIRLHILPPRCGSMRCLNRLPWADAHGYLLPSLRDSCHGLRRCTTPIPVS